METINIKINGMQVTAPEGYHHPGGSKSGTYRDSLLSVI